MVRTYRAESENRQFDVLETPKTKTKKSDREQMQRIQEYRATRAVVWSVRSIWRLHTKANKRAKSGKGGEENTHKTNCPEKCMNVLQANIVSTSTVKPRETCSRLHSQVSQSQQILNPRMDLLCIPSTHDKQATRFFFKFAIRHLIADSVKNHSVW